MLSQSAEFGLWTVFVASEFAKCVVLVQITADGCVQRLPLLLLLTTGVNALQSAAAAARLPRCCLPASASSLWQQVPIRSSLVYASRGHDDVTIGRCDEMPESLSWWRKRQHSVDAKLPEEAHHVCHFDGDDDADDGARRVRHRSAACLLLLTTTPLSPSTATSASSSSLSYCRRPWLSPVD